jgi:hypothetical protein
MGSIGEDNSSKGRRHCQRKLRIALSRLPPFIAFRRYLRFQLLLMSPIGSDDVWQLQLYV